MELVLGLGVQCYVAARESSDLDRSGCPRPSSVKALSPGWRSERANCKHFGLCRIQILLQVGARVCWRRGCWRVKAAERVCDSYGSRLAFSPDQVRRLGSTCRHLPSFGTLGDSRQLQPANEFYTRRWTSEKFPLGARSEIEPTHFNS